MTKGDSPSEDSIIGGGMGCTDSPIGRFLLEAPWERPALGCTPTLDDEDVV